MHQPASLRLLKKTQREGHSAAARTEDEQQALAGAGALHQLRLQREGLGIRPLWQVPGRGAVQEVLLEERVADGARALQIRDQIAWHCRGDGERAGVLHLVHAGHGRVVRLAGLGDVGGRLEPALVAREHAGGAVRVRVAELAAVLLGLRGGALSHLADGKVEVRGEGAARQADDLVGGSFPVGAVEVLGARADDGIGAQPRGAALRHCHREQHRRAGGSGHRGTY